MKQLKLRIARGKKNLTKPDFHHFRYRHKAKSSYSFFFLKPEIYYGSCSPSNTAKRVAELGITMSQKRQSNHDI